MHKFFWCFFFFLIDKAIDASNKYMERKQPKNIYGSNLSKTTIIIKMAQKMMGMGLWTTSELLRPSDDWRVPSRCNSQITWMFSEKRSL